MWFLFSLSAGLLFSANRLILRTIAKNHNPIGLVTIHDFLAGLLLAPALLFSSNFFPTSLNTWGLIGAVTALLFLTDLFATKALATIEASLYQIIGQLRHGFVLLGAIALFGESLTFAIGAALVILTTGVAIALLQRSQFHYSEGVTHAILSAVFISLASLLIKKASTDISSTALGVIVLIGAGTAGFAALGFDSSTLYTVYRNEKKRLLITTALFAIFQFCFFKAIEIGDVSRVTPVIQSSMVFTIIGGYFFLNERTFIMRKIIGACFVSAAIVMIYFL